MLSLIERVVAGVESRGAMLRADFQTCWQEHPAVIVAAGALAALLLLLLAWSWLQRRRLGRALKAETQRGEAAARSWELEKSELQRSLAEAGAREAEKLNRLEDAHQQALEELEQRHARNLENEPTRLSTAPPVRLR